MKRLLIFLYEFVPVLSLIIAIVAIFQSNRALRLSEEANEISNNMNVIALEANQIALESNQSNVKISYPRIPRRINFATIFTLEG